jgi:hypothetical protein
MSLVLQAWGTFKTQSPIYPASFCLFMPSNFFVSVHLHFRSIHGNISLKQFRPVFLTEVRKTA